MKRIRPAAFLVLLLGFLSAHAETLTGRVVRVTDGDTIVVLDADKAQHKIRLQGIDAPECGQAFGTKSKEHLSDLLWVCSTEALGRYFLVARRLVKIRFIKRCETFQTNTD